MSNMIMKQRKERNKGFPLREFMGMTLLAASLLLSQTSAFAGAVRPGFSSFTLAPNDDGSTGLLNIGFNVDFFSSSFTQLYLNNNGNVTFDEQLWTYTPFSLSSTNQQIIAPFFADVDTRERGNPVQYGNGTVDGHAAWGATWQGVDCFAASTTRTVLNTFQMLLIERYDTGPGNFDIEFNYDQIQWDSGQASGGNFDCLDGTSARVGYANGTIESYELPGSGVPGAFLDNGPAETSLIQNSMNSDILGRYIFEVREGVILPPCDDNDEDGLCNDEDPDDDNDTVLDTSDNCPLTANTDQADESDHDGIGEVCDDDDDNDSVLDTDDNCQFTANTDQSDIDGDGQGDVCDGDSDGDGVGNADDNCVDVANTDQSNNDGDAQGDACDPDDDNDGVADNQPDNCPMTANADQDDLDNDNIGDACDLDIDGDGIENADDNCPWTDNIAQEDTDSDGFGDACDDDDDNDGVLDTDDNCSLISNPGQEDADEDGQGDVCDGDLDGDGVDNETDNCPNVANGSQADYDGDMFGDACDDDIDGDGVINDSDACAFTELAIIADSTGCSIDQLCPCEGPRGIASLWKNHGKFVSCTAKSAESFVEAGLITEVEKDAIVSDAAQSDCGDKK